jgi:hypothetical protein
LLFHKSVNSEDDSIEERVFVDVTPSYLTGLLKDRLEIHGKKLVEPYIGKWLSVTGAVKDVDSEICFPITVPELPGSVLTPTCEPIIALGLAVIAWARSSRALASASRLLIASVPALAGDGRSHTSNEPPIKRTPMRKSPDAKILGFIAGHIASAEN